MSERLPRKLWDRATLPTEYVSDQLGIARHELRRALHKIKRQAGLRGDELVAIYDNGDVLDRRGDAIGNLLDEC